MNPNNALYPILQNEARIELKEKYDLVINEDGSRRFNENDLVPFVDMEIVLGENDLPIVVKHKVNYLRILKHFKNRNNEYKRI